MIQPQAEDAHLCAQPVYPPAETSWLDAMRRGTVAVNPHHDGATEEKEKFTRDRSGRLHLTWSRTGPFHVYMRSSKFFSSTIVGHCRDLKPLIEQQQKHRVVDGGPDWSGRSTATIMKLGQLWKDCNLDILAAVSYAPYHSRYNPIEHAWSPRSNDLTGVVLPATLDGDNKPPSQQTGLSTDDVLRKEAVIHDAAMAIVSGHWADKDMTAIQFAQ